MEDMGLAYRKAKVDLYYSSNASILAIASYEENLLEHLNSLLNMINGEDEKWFDTPSFVGDWTLATKSVSWLERKKYREVHGNGVIFSSPAEEWGHARELLARDEDNSNKPEAEFRVMARCSLDFHVLSSLWMLKVGHLFDEKLTGCAYGNRLRRTQSGQGINPLSLGSFLPYLKPFRDWRDQGITAMRVALEADKEIVALTADVSSFYHELNPGFMLEPEFIEGVLSIDLSDEQKRLNRLFIRALEVWAANTPLKKGLPVGLPASAVVANMGRLQSPRATPCQKK